MGNDGTELREEDGFFLPGGDGEMCIRDRADGGQHGDVLGHGVGGVQPAAQARCDEAAELHEQQAARVQAAIQRKEEAIRMYWDAQMEKIDQANAGKKSMPAVKGRPNARSAEARICLLYTSRCV